MEKMTSISVTLRGQMQVCSIEYYFDDYQELLINIIKIPSFYLYEASTLTVHKYTNTQIPYCIT